jgi:hypothetical protein
VQENESLYFLTKEQEEWLLVLQQVAKVHNQQAEDQLKENSGTYWRITEQQSAVLSCRTTSPRSIWLA